MSEINHVWRLRKRPFGEIADDDLSFEEEAIPEPKEGEFLFRLNYLSLDPTNRIPTCGLISQYNEKGEIQGPKNYEMVLMQRVTIQGFVVSDYGARYPEAIAALSQWMTEGKIKTRLDTWSMVLRVGCRH